MKKLWQCLLVLVILLLSYGQTLQMYFWQDDSALLWKLQNPFVQAGSFGDDLIGGGAYKYLVTWFVPFFPLFKLNPFPYFLVGFLTYGAVVSIFYVFSKELTKSKKIGYISTLIFAAGYIGSDIMFRIINSWQTNIGLALGLLTFWVFIRYLDSRKVKYYILGLLSYWAAIEFVYVRSTTIIAPILMLDVTYSMFPFKPKRILGMIVRQTPLWALFYKYYLSFYLSGGTAGSASLISDIFVNGQLEKLIPFVANIGNIFVPTKLQEFGFSVLVKAFTTESVDSLIVWFHMLVAAAAVFILFALARIYKSGKTKSTLLALPILFLTFFNLSIYDQDISWYKGTEVVVSGLVGFVFSYLVIVLASLLWKKRNRLAKVIVFGYFLAASQFFTYFTQYPTSFFGTTHRYFSHSLMGYSIVFGVLIFLPVRYFKNRFRKSGRKLLMYAGFIPLAILISANVGASFKYQKRIVRDRSVPSQKFYQVLQKLVPVAEPGSVFYFDIKDSSYYTSQFGDFFSVGSMPESTAIAIYYGLDRDDIVMITNFQDLIGLLKQGEVDSQKVHTFYYGEHGLISTTDNFRKFVSSLECSTITNLNPEIDEGRNLLIPESDIDPSIPLKVSIAAQISPDVKDINYPFSFGRDGTSLLPEWNDDTFEYLLARKDYRANTKIQSDSEWFDNVIGNAIDGDRDTVWWANRGVWHETEYEEVVLDLGRVTNINRFIWTNWKTELTPTDYEVLVSLDGDNYESIYVQNSVPHRGIGETVIDEFSPMDAKYVKIAIDKTTSNDAPAFLELEVVETKFSEVDLWDAWSIELAPFVNIKNQEEMNMILSKVAPLLSFTLDWETDKGKDSVSVSVGELDTLIDYEFFLRPGGTRILSMQLDVLNSPVEIDIDSATLSTVCYDKLESELDIKQ